MPRPLPPNAYYTNVDGYWCAIHGPSDDPLDSRRTGAIVVQGTDGRDYGQIIYATSRDLLIQGFRRWIERAQTEVPAFPPPDHPA